MGLFENIIIIAYLSVIAYLGYLGYKKTNSMSDYLLAGRDTHPFVMALSYGATFISTAAIIGFGGVSAWLGNSIFWLIFLNIFLGIFIAFVFLGNPTRQMGIKLNAHTFPELLGKRFDSKFIQACGGTLVIVFMPLYATAVLIGGTQFIAIYLGIEYEIALLGFSLIITAYVIAGGLKGVMYTDALQGSMMFIAMFVLLAITLNALGGVEAAYFKLNVAWKNTVMVLNSTSLQELKPGSADFMMKLSTLWGFEGWDKMPKFFSQGWLFIVTTITLGVGIGVLAQPQLVVRFMTVKSKQELNRAVLIGAVFILITTGVVYIVGALSNAWYYEFNAGKNALQSAGSIGKVIPHFISHAMPSWFGVIFLLALISAAMSTLSSQFHTMGTALSRDLIGNYSKKDASMLLTRFGIIIMILFAVSLAYAFDKQPAIIARSTAIFFALCAAIFLPTYIGGLFWKRMTKAGAIASMFTGLCVSSFWLVFVHFKEAKALGIAKALTGSHSVLSGKIIFVDSLIIALPLSVLAAVVVSLFTQPMCEKHLKKCF